MSFLLADIGGTYTRLAVLNGNKMSPITGYENKNFKSLEDVLSHYLSDKEIPQHFIAGIAGVPKDDIIQMPNLSWKIDNKKLKKTFRFKTIRFVNDFALQGYGIRHLRTTDFVEFGGKKKKGPALIMGAGTGLGVCFSDQSIFESEAGHATAVGLTTTQKRIIDNLARKFGHVSFERLVSGPGLENIYFILSRTRATTWDIYSYAKKNNLKALQSYQLLFEFWGILAGNLALSLKTTGGIYLVGNIISDPFIMKLFKKSKFRSYFEKKGRCQSLLKEIPIYVVTRKNLAFDGLKELAKQEK